MNRQNLNSIGTGKTYIVGAGIAGLLVADALNELYKQTFVNQPLPAIEVIDQAPQVADKLTKGNGRSMSVTEGLIAAGTSQAELEIAFSTPVAQGGMLCPEWSPTEADQQAIAAYIRGAGVSVQQRALLLERHTSLKDAETAALQRKNDALLRFGFANFELWREFARNNPEIAAKAGLQMDLKFRIYECPDAAARAHREVAHLNRIGAEFGDDGCGQLLSYLEVIALDPSLQPYFASKLDDAGEFHGYITQQPGGVVHGGILAQELEQKLRASGNVTFTLNLTVQGIERDSLGRIIRLKVLQNGTEIAIGSAQDQFVFATGNDFVLRQADITAQTIFPVAGTTITISVDEAAVRQAIPFSRKSWKQDGVGPLVISPTFRPSDEFLEFLDTVVAATFNPGTPEVQALEFFSREFVTTFDAETFDLRSIDPRWLESFNPNWMGPKAGRWEIRVGGLKFYPGQERALDLEHPGAQWALREQVRKAMEFMPELMAHVLERDLTLLRDANGNLVDRVTAEDVAKLQPWVGARPMYNHGMAAVGAFCENGFLITGTGSWGMACGLGNAAIVSQLLVGVPKSGIRIGSIASHWVADYLEQVEPSQVKSQTSAGLCGAAGHR